MILQEYLEIRPNGKSCSYYKNLGYNVKRLQPILIKNEDVQRDSSVMELIKCDKCGQELIRKHGAIMDTRESFGLDLCPICAEKARQEKTKATNLEKYGVEFPMQSKEIKEKAKNTSREHFGCDYSFQNKEFNKVAREAFSEKYRANGVLSVSKFREQINKTNIEIYGVENPFANEDIKTKIRNTCLEKYGCEYASQVAEVQEKTKQTMLERYGVEHPLQSSEIKEKMEQTCLERYDTRYPMQNEEVASKARKTLTENNNIPTSVQQLKVFEIIKEMFPNSLVELNYPLSSLSLDVVLFLSDDLKIDIEYDGSYWHTDAQKDRRRDEIVKKLGFKILRIKSGKKIPTKEQLKQEINYISQNDKMFAQIILSDWES